MPVFTTWNKIAKNHPDPDVRRLKLIRANVIIDDSREYVHCHMSTGSMIITEQNRWVKITDPEIRSIPILVNPRSKKGKELMMAAENLPKPT